MTDEGIFGKARKGFVNAIQKVNQSNNGLTETSAAFGKIGAVLAQGAGVHSDAQRLAIMLASYGEGDRLGKYAFSSIELAGSPARTEKREYDDRGRAEKGEGSLRVETVEVPAVTGSLGITGPRLRDAVAFLVGKGWAKTTDDGEFAAGTDFHEVSLTAAGRESIQGFVTKAGGMESGMPSLFGDGPVEMRQAADRDAMMASLSKAKVKFSVEHGEDGTTTIEHAGGVFNYDKDGALLGVGANERSK